jgi:glutamate N-acetyltransferase/amino-acid N-acetyltransferase
MKRSRFRMSDLHLLSPLGFKASAVYAGIKTKQTPDVGLLVCDTIASAAAVFTTNKVFAAPVKIGREHVAQGKLRGVVVNSGNANACTGKQGERDAISMCATAAKLVGCEAREMLPSSTGIIGHLMPMEKVTAGIHAAAADLGNSEGHALKFADAILTTDLTRKSEAVEVEIGKQRVRIAGVCKGSGMIGPRMTLHAPPHATMLAYLTTDAKVAPPLLRKLLAKACAGSFNAVTVDDHMSTNDTAALLASGASGAVVSTAKEIERFSGALEEVCESLAYQIAADGEGATKVVAITVTSAASEKAAKAIARAIANSPLVKCAMHGNDPNWGRIVSAAGLCGVPFDADRCQLTLQGTAVFRRGRPLVIDAAALSKQMDAKEVQVHLSCGLGEGKATVWTCDLSREYITINADYHT